MSVTTVPQPYRVPKGHVPLADPVAQIATCPLGTRYQDYGTKTKRTRRANGEHRVAITEHLDVDRLAEQALQGVAMTRDEALAVLRTPDERLPELLQATFTVRRRYHGKRVKVCVLQNAKSGLCPEDCGYCSQSAVSKAPIEKYRLLSKEQLLDGARRATEAGAKRYCMVTSSRGPTERDIEHFVDAVAAITQRYPQLELCVSLGIMDEAKARRLKAAGVGWINHNLNTSRRFYPAICTTHTYDDRVETVKNVRAAGLMTCSGGIIGMGETDEDVVELAFTVRALAIDSIPVNFLHAIPGTPLGDAHEITPTRALKALCLFRLLNPKADIRAAGGREVNLRSMQAMALYAANSIFVEGYLTTPGQQAASAHQMIADMGFEVEGADLSPSAPNAAPATEDLRHGSAISARPPVNASA